MNFIPRRSSRLSTPVVVLVTFVVVGFGINLASFYSFHGRDLSAATTGSDYSSDVGSAVDGDFTAPTTPERVERIDQLISRNWAEFSITPSRPATDGEWCRRVYLDVLGRIPTVEELTAFTGSKDKDKKQQLVETLLYDDKYTETFARNWTTIWTNLLIGRTGGTDRNSMISREGMQKYLRDSFARNKSYDRIVHELITATGSTTPGEDDFNGATNFLIDKVNEEDAAQATAATTKIFLGLQVQCTQCHNHPFNNWKQSAYWEMNAFFRQTRAFGSGMRGDTGAAARLLDQDFPGESGDIENADLFFEMRNGIVKQALPVFVDGTAIEPNGMVNVVNRREEFARLVRNSPFMAKIMVNRIWGHFLGYGLTRPVDDLGPHNIPSNPELLEFLAQEFRSSEYDVRELISWIVLSEPYSLSSIQNESNATDDPLLGNAPRFSQFYLRQMQAEQLYESLLVATRADETRGGSYEEQEQQKSRWLQQFSTAFGTDEGDEATSFNGTIPQVLMMFNGEMMKTVISTEQGSLIDRLMRDDSMTDRDRIDYLFLAGLSRKPTRDEKSLAKEIFVAREGNTREALKDVWWIVLNSNEFIFNH